MFERFTEQAIKAIMLAQEEARRMMWNHVGTEQMLLGMLREGSDIAAEALDAHGVHLEQARSEVDKIVGVGDQNVGAEIPFTPRAKRQFELAWDAGRQLGHNYIGTEHLLLALIRDGEGVGVRALTNMGVNLPKLKETVDDLIAKTEADPKRRNKPRKFEPKPPANPAFGQGPDIAEKLADEQPNLVEAMQEEARRLSHNFIGTEQILLGIMHAEADAPSTILNEMGIGLKQLREAVEKIIGRGTGAAAREISFTPRSKRVLELSQQEAVKLGQQSVQPAHLLLGLIREGDGVAIRVLQNLGVDLKALETRLRESLSS